MSLVFPEGRTYMHLFPQTPSTQFLNFPFSAQGHRAFHALACEEWLDLSRLQLMTGERRRSIRQGVKEVGQAFPIERRKVDRGIEFRMVLPEGWR